MGFTDSFKKVIGLSVIADDEIVTEEELAIEKRKLEREAKVERNREFALPVSTSRSQGSRDVTVNTDNSNSRPSPAFKVGEKRFSVAGTNSLKLILIEPTGFDECPKLVDSLKSRKPIIINLEKLETETARKIFDFLSGATYALDGNVQKIANNIFIFTPDNVSVSAQQPQGDGEDQGRWR